MNGSMSSQMQTAERMMRQHRFDAAIEQLTEHLREHPADAKALLQLGICHLLNRSEDRFAAIYREAEDAVERMSPPPPEVSRLWTLYRSLAAKVSTTALIVTAAASAGCDRNGRGPDVAPETTPTATAAEATPPPDTSAGTFAAPPPQESADAGALAASTAPTASSAPATAAPPTTTTRPAHRYSGGVRPPVKTPAHRYSGGVLRN